MALNHQQEQVLLQLAEICKPIVQAIEAEPALTLDRYDRYMTAISGVTAKMPGKNSTLAVALAMKMAGGNKNGIIAALRILGVTE